MRLDPEVRARLGAIVEPEHSGDHTGQRRRDRHRAICRIINHLKAEMPLAIRFRTLLARGFAGSCCLSFHLGVAATVPHRWSRGSRGAGDYLPGDYFAIPAIGCSVSYLAEVMPSCTVPGTIVAFLPVRGN